MKNILFIIIFITIAIPKFYFSFFLNTLAVIEKFWDYKTRCKDIALITSCNNLLPKKYRRFI